MNSLGQLFRIHFPPAVANCLVQPLDRRNCRLRGLASLGRDLFVATNGSIQFLAKASQSAIQGVDGLFMNDLRRIEHVQAIGLHDQDETTQRVGHSGILGEMADKEFPGGVSHLLGR